MRNRIFYETIGKSVEHLNKLEEVLDFTGLNYLVESQEIFLKNGNIIPNKFANVIKEDDTFLGIVGKDYKIIQNVEGFSFLKYFENDYKYIRASSFDGRKGAILVLKRVVNNLIKNEFNHYILITNKFDGIGNIDIYAFVEKDGIPIYISSIKNQSIKHSGLAKINKEYSKKLEIELDNIFSKYEKTLEELKYSVDIEFVKNILVKVSYSDVANTRILIERANKIISDILLKFYSYEDKTALNFLISVADYEMNREPIRNTGNEEIYLQRFLDKMDLTNRTLKLIRRSK